MARATNTKIQARKARDEGTVAVPKRKPGRPLGSTNARKPSLSTTAKVTKLAGKRQPAFKVTAARAPAPKLNKAALTLHVAKLERIIVKLREKNKEFKQAASAAAKPKPGTAAQAPKSVRGSIRSGKPNPAASHGSALS